MTLTEQQAAILTLERQWFRRPGAKEQAMHGLGLTPTEYYRQLLTLIDLPDALALDPVTVGRLRERQGRRAAQRRR